MSEKPLVGRLVDAYRANAEKTLDLLDMLSDDAFDCVADKTKSVRAQFAHVHHVRIAWIGPLAPDLANGLEKIPKGAPRATYREQLVASGEAMCEMLRRGFEGKKYQGNWADDAGMFSYMIAHEAHHRGQIEIVLRQAAHPIDDADSFGLWMWKPPRANTGA